jgi:hypothetical protein
VVTVIRHYRHCAMRDFSFKISKLTGWRLRGIYNPGNARLSPSSRPNAIEIRYRRATHLFAGSGFGVGHRSPGITRVTSFGLLSSICTEAVAFDKVPARNRQKLFAVISYRLPVNKLTV